jgi:hypothetical protein
MQLQISEERQTQLSEYAARHGLDPAGALDQVLAEALSGNSETSRKQ